MSLTESQIEQNWNKLLSIIGNYCPDKPTTNRWTKLYDFHQEYANRIALMPASTKESYHGAFTGGYVAHVLNVHNTANNLMQLWKSSGAKIDFSTESLDFVALTHDLGKFGTKEIEGFSDDVDSWEKKRGVLYKMGTGIQFMKDCDRSLFLLQEMGVEVSESEYLAIKLHAGLFEEANKSYFLAYNSDYKLQSNLPFILHQADWMCARIESEGTINVGTSISKPKIAEPPVTDNEEEVTKPTKPVSTKTNRFAGRI